jgi:tight adherence protein B
MVMNGLILVAVFLTVVLVIWGVYMLVAQAPLRQQQKIIGYRVDALIRSGERGVGGRGADVFKRDVFTSLPRFQDWLLRLPRAASLGLALRQGDWRISVPTFALMSAVIGAGLYLIAAVLWKFLPLSLVLGLLGLSVPYVILVYKRRRRFDRFLTQFPEAIDLISRAIRAGHAVPTGFEMVATEMEAPVADEFRQVYDQQKFGLALNQAMANLMLRVPLLDVRMMVTAIAIQREVGGNLSEVLDKLAQTIRERMRIRGQIRIYTAQGKMTGTILALLPVVLGLVLLAINRDYFRILFEHPYGLYMLGFAGLLEITGYFWIRKIIRIKI